VTDAETTLLYTLSTLAQTCAALAAFVGAVGLYRLQWLRARPRDILWEIATTLNRAQGTARASLLGEARRVAASDENMKILVAEYDRNPRRITNSIVAMAMFEAWNLLVIFSALVGFNHVPVLAGCAWTLPLLWPVAAVTVGVTGYCVFVWTRG
jgi:hypothetical protein